MTVCCCVGVLVLLLQVLQLRNPFGCMRVIVCLRVGTSQQIIGLFQVGIQRDRFIQFADCFVLLASLGEQLAEKIMVLDRKSVV